MCKERAVGSYENVQGGWWQSLRQNSGQWTPDKDDTLYPFPLPPTLSRTLFDICHSAGETKAGNATQHLCGEGQKQARKTEICKTER